MCRIVTVSVIKYILSIILLFCVQVYAFGDWNRSLQNGYHFFKPYGGYACIYREIAPDDERLQISVFWKNGGGSCQESSKDRENIDVVPPNIVKISMKDNIIFGFLEEPTDRVKENYYFSHGNPVIDPKGYFILNIQNHNVILDLDEETWLNQLKLYGITNPQLQLPEHFERVDSNSELFNPNFTVYLIIFLTIYFGVKIYLKRNSSKKKKKVSETSDTDRIDWCFIGSIIFKLTTAFIFVILILGASFELLLCCSTVYDVSEKSIEERMFVHPSHFHCVYLDNISRILSYTKIDASLSNHPFFTDESFTVLQKYEDFDIWKVKYTRLGREYVFLYTPIPALPEQEIITACDFGIWDTELECYSPNILPFEKGKDISVKWSYFIQPNNISTIEGMPPLPGCVVKDIDGTKTLLYPRKLLPLIEQIYPNIKIPEQQLFDVDILPVNDKVK